MPNSTIQCVKPPGRGASGSCTTSASDFAPDGTPVHSSGGVLLAPAHVSSVGIGPLGANAMLFNVIAPAKHPRVTLTPTLMSGGRMQIVIGVHGELATVSADAAPVTHPIDHEDTVVIAPGEKSEVDIDVHSSGPEEGWKRVHYRLSVVGTF